jgi:hypothetical protein
VALSNRQHPKIVQTFAMLLGIPASDLLSSHDKYALHRPTRAVPITAQDNDEKSTTFQDKPEWATPRSLHLDMDPVSFLDARQHRRIRELREKLCYDDSKAQWTLENNLVTAAEHRGLHLQAVLNLLDNFEEDGGLQVIPNFRAHFRAFVNGKLTDHVKGAEDAAASHRCDLPESLDTFAVRVPVRAGCLIVWDQRTAHGTKPNKSACPRAVQFFKMFPRSLLSAPHLKRRSCALEAELKSARLRGFGMSNLGRCVFGQGTS